ncbi:MAG: NAD(P)H-binding protein [Moorea sp. SIO4A3]|nr:NAD(P)H-binding protein [Moorena sp. SIO4A3]
MTSKALLYGATGYVGELIAKLAKSHGLELIIAGRNQRLLPELASKLNLEFRVFGLDNSKGIESAIEDIEVVINCAGPFSRSAKPLIDACLVTKTHYTDIAGEVPEFEALVALDAQARASEVMVLPGIGFGVVPTDCMAVYLKSKLPQANKLTLIYETQGGVSRGTANTVLPNLHKIGVVRQGGQLVPARPAASSLKIDLGAGTIKAVTNPWRADLVTAFYSTGIGNIEVYTVFPAPVSFLMQASRYLGWFFRSSLFQSLLKRLIQTLPSGPTETERAKGKTRVLGIVEDESGQTATARLEGPEAYNVTVLAAIATIKHILKGEFKPGFQTPASVYGADLILEVEGTKRFG